MIFSKFIPLDYKKGDYILNNFSIPLKNKENKSNNEKFYEILHYSSLYAATFEQMNDIDECTYSTSYPPEFLQQCDEIVANILDIKRNKRICAFSRENKIFKEDLMWAHYANGCLGAKIVFEVPDNNYHKVIYSSRTPKIHYDSNNNLLKLIDNNNKEMSLNISKNDKERLSIDTNNPSANIDKFIATIMRYKKECWRYEQEYRAIITQERLPIIINEIILGKKFCKINRPFSENGHIKCIAEQIKSILINSGNYSEDKYPKDNLPKIKAYRERYANEIVEY